MTDIGLATVEDLRERMAIDAEWSVPGRRGFTWWPHRLAQHVWAEECVDDEGVILSRVHVRTDFLTGFAATDEQLRAVGDLMADPSLLGLARDPADPSRLQLAGSVYVHEQNRPWAVRLALACALGQACEAHLLSEFASESTGLAPAASGHPVLGVRPAVDGVLNGFLGFVRPAGETPGRFGETLAATLQWLDQKEFLCSGGADGLVVELPFGSSTSLLKFTDGHQHPLYGYGLLVSLALPLSMTGRPVEARVAQALDLNGAQATDQTWTHAVGSWTAGPIGPLYQAFVPAAFADDPGVGQNLFLAEILRARWAAHVFGQPEDAEPLDHMARIQEMLAMGADQFDQVLRHLPPGTNPDDVRELFEVLREQRNRRDEPASGRPGGGRGGFWTDHPAGGVRVHRVRARTNRTGRRGRGHYGVPSLPAAGPHPRSVAGRRRCRRLRHPAGGCE